jgi:hypothetical protein
MVVVELIGGLGNQLFQYAAGRQLAHLRKTELKLNNAAFETYTLHNYSLQHYTIDAGIATAQEVQQLENTKTLFLRGCAKIFKKLGINRPIGKTYREKSLAYDPYFEKLPSTILLYGFWQSPKYFEAIRSILLEELAVNVPLADVNLEIAEKIKACNAVSLHIRRGDYVSNAGTLSVHGICDLDYYKRCIAIITKEVENPHFFIFSDDPEWTRENLKLDQPATFVTNNDANTNFEDLRLMSLCKHNIIANSSFSWWGAWLNQNPEKIVLAPKIWFANEALNAQTTDLIPSNWRRV